MALSLLEVQPSLDSHRGAGVGLSTHRLHYLIKWDKCRAAALLENPLSALRLELPSGERQSLIPASCDKYGPGKNEPTLPRVDMI